MGLSNETSSLPYKLTHHILNPDLHHTDPQMDLFNELNQFIRRANNTTSTDDYIPLDLLLKPPRGANNQTAFSEFSPQLSRSVLQIILLVVAYGLVVVISLFGNSLVCNIIYKTRRMHTVTNLFIANLALSDLLITVFNIPFTVARNVMNQWVFGNVLCQLVNFILMCSVYVSTFTMSAIAIDRYIVIVYPLRPRMTLRVGAWLSAGTWTLGSLMSVPFAVYAKVQKVDLMLSTVIRCRLCYPDPAET